MNFSLSDTVTLPDVDTVYATVDGEDDQTETSASEEERTEESEAPEEPEVQEPEKTSNLGSYLLIGLIAAGVGVGAWYMKIYKPKHEFDDDDEYEEFEDYDNETYEKDDADADQDYEPEVMDDEED